MVETTVMRNPTPGASRAPGQGIGVDTFTSITAIDPTTSGPFAFEIQADNVFIPFIPIGGSVFLENTENQDQWLYGIVDAFDETVTPAVLHISKVLTSVDPSETISSWFITILDGPPRVLPFFSITGLRVTADAGDPLHDIHISEGSVMDSTGKYLLTLPAAIVKRLDAAFLEGTGQGAYVQSANLAGTVSSAALVVTGTGTAFLSDFTTAGGKAKLTDYEDQFIAWKGAAEYASRQRGSIISAGAVTTQIVASSNTAALSDNALAAAGVTYKRGGWPVNGNLAAVIARRDSDGYIDVFSCAFNASGNPDLPAGYTYYRVLASLLVTASAIDTNEPIFQPLYGISAPQAREIYFDTVFTTTIVTNDVQAALEELDTAVGNLVAAVVPATTAVPGIVELATNSETNTGTDTDRAVVPAGLAFRLQSNTGIASQGPLTSSNATGGVGYASGAGGIVTQATSKSNGVTLNRVTGLITMNGAALAANTEVQFTLTNSAIDATDTVIANHRGVATFGAYLVQVVNILAGSCVISLRNMTAGSLSQAITIRFTVIKGTSS